MQRGRRMDNRRIGVHVRLKGRIVLSNNGELQ